MVKYVVDTHALVWFLENSHNLGNKAKEILKAEDRTLIIPTIVLAEMKYLHKRYRFSTPMEEVIEAIERDKNCLIYPLDIKVLEVIPSHLNIHDGIIVGTALAFQETLEEEIKVLTKDEEIKAANLVQTVW